MDGNSQQLQQLMQAAEADRSAELQATQAALQDFSKKEQRLRNSKEAALVAMEDAKQVLHECTAAHAQEAKNLERSADAVEAIGKELEALHQQRRDLQRRARDGVNVRQFGGSAMERLRNLINKEESKFSHPPIGPLGYHLDLKDDKWGYAAQAAIGMLLDTVFVVHNWRDKQLLQV